MGRLMCAMRLCTLCASCCKNLVMPEGGEDTEQGLKCVR